jgi:hypothetical protein
MSSFGNKLISSPPSPSTLIKNMAVGMSHSDRGEEKGEGETSEITSTLTPCPLPPAGEGVDHAQK